MTATSIYAQVNSTNKSIAPPNQNLHIYTNHFPFHSVNIINQPSSCNHHIHE